MLDPVNPSRLWQRHPALRWFAPAGVVAVIALITAGVFDAGAASTPTRLPRTSAAALLADVRSAEVAGFSGTVVSSVSLGLPELPSLGLSSGASSSLTSLVSGSHTLQVWYGGPAEQRVALFGATDETDVFHDGRDVWQWSSADRTALHAVLPAGASASPAAGSLPSGGLASTTPAELARRLLGALDPTTSVRVVTGGRVADRPAYDLVLVPRSAETLIGSVRIAVDGATKMPLGVRVFARGARQPAIDVTFSSIRFVRPSDRNFAFTPPSDASVRTLGRHSRRTTRGARPSPPAPHPGALPADRRRVTYPPKVIGSGWARIVSAQLPGAALRDAAGSPLWRSLTPVSGAWGSGRLLRSALLSALVTDNGSVYLGAVGPAALYAAAGAK